MSIFKFTLWIIWIGILLSIGAVILLPLAALMIILIPVLLIGALIA
jgi:hypothetical protein